MDAPKGSTRARVGNVTFCPAPPMNGPAGPRLLSRTERAGEMSIENAISSTPAIDPERYGSPANSAEGCVRFIGEDPATRKLKNQVQLVAPHLRLGTIEGEPGVGKETLARHIYLRAISANSQLQRVRFSRHDAREWLLSEGEASPMTGFLYLYHLDLLGAPGQALLLRMLKRLEAWPAPGLVLIGSSEGSLRELATRGQFLPDLAFRLGAIRFAIPPLRDRRADIVPLATFLLDRIRIRYHLQPFRLSADAIEQMLEYRWPGNVRELASVLESAVVASNGPIIYGEDLALRPSAPLSEPPAPARTLNLDAAIREHVRYVLELNHGNKLRAARQLGISRSTLYRMLSGAIS